MNLIMVNKSWFQYCPHQQQLKPARNVGLKKQTNKTFVTFSSLIHHNSALLIHSKMLDKIMTCEVISS